MSLVRATVRRFSSSSPRPDQLSVGMAIFTWTAAIVSLGFCVKSIAELRRIRPVPPHDYWSEHKRYSASYDLFPPDDDDDE